MGPVLDAWERMDLAPIVDYLGRTAARLAAAGCDFFVCPDNTAHIAFEHPATQLALPGLHIADIVARAARDAGHHTLGLLGTTWTMTQPMYPSALTRAGLVAVTPPEPDRRRVDEVIFTELCRGEVTETARRDYVRIIADLEAAGCDGVILGCTEIPLLVTPEVSTLPTLDSTRLLARAAVAVALGASPSPRWRGGPPIS